MASVPGAQCDRRHLAGTSAAVTPRQCGRHSVPDTTAGRRHHVSTRCHGHPRPAPHFLFTAATAAVPTHPRHRGGGAHLPSAPRRRCPPTLAGAGRRRRCRFPWWPQTSPHAASATRARPLRMATPPAAPARPTGGAGRTYRVPRGGGRPTVRRRGVIFHLVAVLSSRPAAAGSFSATAVRRRTRGRDRGGMSRRRDQRCNEAGRRVVARTPAVIIGSGRGEQRRGAAISSSGCGRRRRGCVGIGLRVGGGPLAARGCCDSRGRPGGRRHASRGAARRRRRAHHAGTAGGLGHCGVRGLCGLGGSGMLVLTAVGGHGGSGGRRH